MFARLVLTLVAAVLWMAPPAGAEPAAAPFHCDGTDPAFFQEMEEAGWVGYGETWDLHTCDQGVDVYVPGAATSRWRAWRLQRARAERKQEVSFYAALFPFVAFGGIGSMFGLAWILAVAQRRRREPRRYLVCAPCQTSVPVAPDDPALRNAFCPACGGPCTLADEDLAVPPQPVSG